MERAVSAEPHQPSAALFCCPSLSTRNLCLEEEGRISLWKLNRGTDSQGTKPNNLHLVEALRQPREMSFSTLFFFHSSHQIFRRCASENAAPAASVSVQSYHWQILTTVFLRCAAQKGWGNAVFFWQWVAHAVSSDGHVSEAAFVPGWHMASQEKCSCRCCFRPGCWEHFEAVSSGQTVVWLLRKEIHC